MSKRKTRPEDIRNPENYFNRFMAVEVERTKKWLEGINNMEDSLEQNMEHADFTYRYATNRNDEEFDKLIMESSFLGWVETIRDERLYHAIKRLKKRQQIILTMFFEEKMKQPEIAASLHISQQAVSKQLKLICKQIMNYY